MPCHAQYAADGHNAGTADPGDDDVVGLVDGRQLRIGQGRQVVVGGNAGALLELRAVYGHERRTESLEAGEVFVAARLIDDPFPAPLGLQRLHRYAVRLHPAIAAAFADEFIDNDALFGVGISVALTAAALLGGACLVVDQHSNARYFRKLFLHLNQFVAVMNGKPARPLRVARVLVRLVGHDNDTLGAFGSHLTSHLRNRKAAVVPLAAGHRHRIVEQDLVGDVGFGRDGGADRHIAGMVVGAVAEILKNMLALGEWRFADPIRALAAHLRIAERRAVHPLRHEMAADTGVSAHAFRHHGR